MKQWVILLLLAALAWLVSSGLVPDLLGGSGHSAWTLGFLLLAAYMVGEILARYRLPRITGYLITGIIFGPHLLGFVDAEAVGKLRVIDSLALTFIALSAGGDLKLAELRGQRRILAWVIVALIVIVFLGSTLIFLAVQGLFSFTREMDFRTVLVMAALLGAIAVARSPASAIAIIKETKAHGPFTEVVLGVTVALDIISIVLFALVVSAGRMLLGGGGLEAGPVIGLVVEIVASLLLGAGVGFLLSAWLKRVRSYHLLTVFILSILVAELARLLSAVLAVKLDVHFHLEPMLICIAAGFVVSNFSLQGPHFLAAIEKGGLMVFTVFFALAGAALDLDILSRTWALALVLVLIRFTMIQAGCKVGTALAGAPAHFKKLLGMTFITQAGVSLGLAKAVEMRFPEWGPTVATLAVATIGMNQIIGPIFFKRALLASGEAESDD